MKILVTGSAGFIGTHLCKKLHRLNHKVIAYDLAQGHDILDFTGMTRACQGQDAIIHLAARTSVNGSNNTPYTYNQTNVEGTLSVLQAVRINKVPKIIFTSTAAVAKPISVYAVTKIAGENYCKAYSYLYGFNAVILRLYNVYGVGSKGAISLFLEQIKNKEGITVYGGNQIRDFVYIDDVVDAFVQALEYKDTNTFDIGSGTSININEVAELCYKLSGKRPKIKHKPELKGELVVSESNISRSIKNLGYTPRVNIEQGIGKMIEEIGI